MTHEQLILSALAKKNYQPLKPKALARRLGVPASQYSDFRNTLRDLVRQNRLEMGRGHSVRPVQPHGAVTGIYRRTGAGAGFVRPHAIDGHAGPEIYIREDRAGDASTGDEV